MRARRTAARRAGSLLLWGFLSAGLGAVPGWAQPAERASSRGTVPIQASGEEATVMADQIKQVGGSSDLLIAVGNVEITRGATRPLADRVELNRETGQAVAQGKAVFYDGPDGLVGDRIDYHLKTGTGVVYNAFAFSAPFCRLSAECMDQRAEALARVLNDLDVRGSTSWDVLNGRAIEARVGIDWRFSCWAISAEYVNRDHAENEFRFSVNLPGLGQAGSSVGGIQ